MEGEPNGEHTLTDEPYELPEDKLLLMPELPVGDITPLWAIRSNILHDRQLAELAAERAGTARPINLLPWNAPQEQQRLAEKHRREQLEYEQRLRDITARQDRLLQRIEYEQAAIEKQRKDCEAHALRLNDGRRVYVDGDRFRDGEGRVLTGADEAEAARQHEYRPDASTWQQKQDIDRRYADAEKLKNEILADRQSGTAPQDEAIKLDGYEKEFAAKVEAKAAQPVTDYGTADDYTLSAVPAFTAAADPVSPKPIRKLTDDDTGTQTADIKKPPQPFGGGGMKLG